MIVFVLTFFTSLRQSKCRIAEKKDLLMACINRSYVFTAAAPASCRRGEWHFLCTPDFLRNGQRLWPIPAP